tara:strand:+ start:14026 stop:14739 length:714 start_codon:yes stop_codon:yes gene_type:complete
MATLNPAVGTGAYTETLQTLRNRILRRLGFAAQISNPPPGMAELVDDFLKSAQDQMAERYPELVSERFFTWTMVAGTRFYTTTGDDEGATSPDYALDPRRISWIGVEDTNGTFTPLIEGIEPQMYTSESQRGLPAYYEIRQAIEVFPAPDAAYLLQVKGHFKNLPFSSDSDVVSMDPELVFLLALANAKAHYRQPDAGNYFTQATNHLGQLTAGNHGTARYVPGAEAEPPAIKPVLV